MNNTQNFVLAGRVYMLETPAAERLARYIEDLKQHFADSSERDEIVNDIELRIAERLSALREKGATVISDVDVRDVLEAIGNPNEMADASTSMNAPAEASPRRLRRDSRNGLLGGVCAGIANYFGVDPMVTRIVTVILALVSGVVLMAIIYVVLWIVLPDAHNPGGASSKGGARVLLAILLAILALPLLAVIAFILFRMVFGIVRVESGFDYSDWITVYQTDPKFTIMYPEDSVVDGDIIYLPETGNNLERTMATRALGVSDASLDQNGCVITGTEQDSGVYVVNAGENEFCLRTVDAMDNDVFTRTYLYTTPTPDNANIIKTTFTISLPMDPDLYPNLEQDTVLFIETLRTLQKQ